MDPKIGEVTEQPPRIRKLIAQAAEFEEMASAEEIDDLERELSAAESFEEWDERGRVDAIYRDAAELEIGGEWGGGET